MEGLLASLIAKERDKKNSGIKIKPTSPPTSHIFFVDDCYIFTKVNTNEFENIMNTLSDFGEVLNKF